MSTDALKMTAEKLVAHCRAGTTKQGLDELYDPSAVSVEAMAMPGTDSAEIHGVDGIKGKHDWWENTMEVHSASTEGPLLHGGDRFAVIFELDVTNKTDGKRSQMREVAIYTVNTEGKIVREEFYYGM